MGGKSWQGGGRGEDNVRLEWGMGGMQIIQDLVDMRTV